MYNIRYLLEIYRGYSIPCSIFMQNKLARSHAECEPTGVRGCYTPAVSLPTPPHSRQAEEKKETRK